MKIAFIGLGNMGGGMAANQAKAGREVLAFDLSKDALDRAVGAGCTAAGSVAEAVKEAEVVVTMLPAGPHVLKVYAEQVFGHAPKSALLIDCSTIDVETARKVAGLAGEAGYAFADAPVSGGTAAADAGNLAFMVGCDEGLFGQVESALEPMSRVTIRAGDHGAGQAAKICNNMLLGASMVATCESFVLAEAEFVLLRTPERSGMAIAVGLVALGMLGAGWHVARIRGSSPVYAGLLRLHAGWSRLRDSWSQKGR